MHKFVLTTDTSCDVFRNELDLAEVAWVPLTYAIDGISHEDNFSSNEEYTEFYSKIRSGALPTTSQINIFSHEEFFNSIIKKGATSIVHLSLSGGLSSTASSASLAADNVMDKHENVKIYIIDTLAATQGHRYILDEAIKLRDEGIEAKQAVKILSDTVAKLHHWIIVDDLMHLKRGGRVSGASAYIGSMLKIKPILIINSEGKLAVVKKVKGTNKAYSSVIEMVAEHCENIIDPKIYIASADASDKAKELETLIKEAYPKAEVVIGWIGPIIGSHTGAETVGIVFKGRARI